MKFLNNLKFLVKLSGGWLWVYFMLILSHIYLFFNNLWKKLPFVSYSWDRKKNLTVNALKGSVILILLMLLLLCLAQNYENQWVRLFSVFILQVLLAGTFGLILDYILFEKMKYKRLENSYLVVVFVIVVFFLLRKILF